MKLKLFLVLALITGFLTNAQNPSENSKINEKDSVIPLKMIENPPLPRNCKEKWSTVKKKTCLSESIHNHFVRKFNTRLADQLGVKGKVDIVIDFVIDTEGNAVDITAEGGPEELNKYAIDVVRSLPKLKPGTENGKPVKVSFTLPIMLFIPG